MYTPEVRNIMQNTNNTEARLGAQSSFGSVVKYTLEMINISYPISAE